MRRRWADSRRASHTSSNEDKRGSARIIHSKDCGFKTAKDTRGACGALAVAGVGVEQGQLAQQIAGARVAQAHAGARGQQALHRHAAFEQDHQVVAALVLPHHGRLRRHFAEIEVAGEQAALALGVQRGLGRRRPATGRAASWRGRDRARARPLRPNGRSRPRWAGCRGGCRPPASAGNRWRCEGQPAPARRRPKVGRAA